MIIVITKRLAIPAGWKGKGDTKIIASSISWKCDSVPEFTSLICCGLIFTIKVAAFCSNWHVILCLAMYFCSKVICICNHPKTWRKCFSSREDGVIPPIVGGTVQVIDSSIGTSKNFVYCRVPVETLVLNVGTGTETSRCISDILVACIWMKVLRTIELVGKNEETRCA